MSFEISVSDALAEIKEQIRVLKARLAELFEERDDLIYHICPELCAKYAAEIGDYQNRALYQEVMILELKRRIEMVRAALNREQTVTKEDMDKQIDEEYQQFHQKVDEEYQKSKDSQEEQAQKEEKRRQYEEQWKNQYGKDERDTRTDDSTNENFGDDVEGKTDKSKDGSVPDLKDLYRKIVKKLHPDMNPDITERELELFHNAAKAYEEGDIVTLQAIYDEVFGIDTDNLAEEESMETLTALRWRLLEQIAKVTEEIEAIKADFPYTEKQFLEDPVAVKAKQDAINQLIQEYEKEISRLNNMLQDLIHQMEEVQRKRR